jgi:general L-amino acid transport system permease protein
LRPAFWNDPRVRAIAFQAILVLAIVLFFWAIVDNALTNMAKRGIRTGFDFLGREAGFGILFHLIAYDESMSYARTFWVGLVNTILVSVLGIVFATIVGFIVGIARLSPNWLISKMAAAYIEIFRNIPLLLQIFFWYTAVLQTLPPPRESLRLGDAILLNNRGLITPKPIFEDGFGWVWIALIVAVVAVVGVTRWAKQRFLLTGQTFPTFWTCLGILIVLPLGAYFATGAPLSWEYAEVTRFSFRGGALLIPELLALLWALTMYTAAFIAETVRAGIQGVSYGQTEAAKALGLRTGLTLRLVIVPQALRIIVPPLTNEYLNLTKNSSLATAIGYPDLVAVFMGTTLNQTGQAVEIVAMTMAVYLLISLVISAVMNLYDRAIALVER